MAQTLAQKRKWGKQDRALHLPERKAYARAWYKKNHVRWAASVLLRKYRLTPEARDAIFARQGFCCGVCKRPDPDFKHGWVIDHDHQTGKVRGVLCNGCNNGLGRFKDNQTILRLAIEYLDRNSEN
jgi:5-methylcytosine-specific restriction endonuclease McrA